MRLARQDFVIMAPAAAFHSWDSSYECNWTEAATAELAWRNLLQGAYSLALVDYAITQGYRLRAHRKLDK